MLVSSTKLQKKVLVLKQNSIVCEQKDMNNVYTFNIYL